MAVLNNNVELHNVVLSPEEKLWRAVMATAIFDALHTPKKTKKGKYKVFTELSDVNEAREWFKTRKGSFETVCEALNLDSDTVHKKMNTKIRQKQFIERIEKNMSGTIICPNCNGNGYVGNSKKEDQQDDCITCKNQGEIALTDETIWNTLQFITRKQ
jgi:hypothetical protein